MKFDRFGVKLLAPRGNRLLALARQRMCGQSDDRNVLGLRVAFQTPRGFPAVNNGHFEVHQDNIRLLGRRHLAPFLAVRGRENLEIPKKLKPHFEHIDVVVVVFDIKHFDHDAAPLPLRTAGLLGHLAVISPEQIVTPRVAKSKLDWPPFELQGRTGARATLGLTRPMPCRPRDGSLPQSAWDETMILRASNVKQITLPVCRTGMRYESPRRWLLGPASTDADGLGHSPAWLMSVRCHSRTSARLFDHLVGAADKRQRNREAERLCGLEIDDQLDFRRLLDRQVGGLFAPENPASINAGDTIYFRSTGAVEIGRASCR